MIPQFNKPRRYYRCIFPSSSGSGGSDIGSAGPIYPKGILDAVTSGSMDQGRGSPSPSNRLRQNKNILSQGSGRFEDAHVVAACPSGGLCADEDVHVKLDQLPTEILMYIAELLELNLSLDHAEVPSSGWIAPETNLWSFSSTSRSIYLATRSRTGRRFGFTFVGDETGLVRQMLQPMLSGDVHPSTHPTSPLRTINPSALRHFYVAMSGIRGRHPGILPISNEVFANAIRGMPRLESFSAVFLKESDIIATSPYPKRLLDRRIVDELGQLASLRSINLCGIAINMAERSQRDQEEVGVGKMEGPTLPVGPVTRAPFSQVDSLVISAGHDSCIKLIALLPNLKRLKIWRNFSAVFHGDSSSWCNEIGVSSWEELELRGFSGRGGKVLLDAWLSRIDSLYSAPNPPISPLTSIRLTEAHSLSGFVKDVLPVLAHLTQLTSFSIIVWKDRRFVPEFISVLARKLPRLKALEVGLENGGLNWWPHPVSEYAFPLSLHRQLESFCWNYSPSATTDFPVAQQSLLAPCTALACESSKLRKISWMGEQEYLGRDGEKEDWKWMGGARNDSQSQATIARYGGGDPIAVDQYDAGTDEREREIAGRSKHAMKWQARGKGKGMGERGNFEMKLRKSIDGQSSLQGKVDSSYSF